MVEKILDAAAQKGTGKWAVIEAVESGIPATVISESVAARSLSALKDQRVKASQLLAGPTQPNNIDESIIEDIKKVLFKIYIHAKVGIVGQHFIYKTDRLRIQDHSLRSRIYGPERKLSRAVWIQIGLRGIGPHVERWMCY